MQQKLEFLVRYLKEELSAKANKLAFENLDLRSQLRALMNIREPQPIDEVFLKIQNEFLSQEAEKKGIIEIENLPTSNKNPKIALWQGDITRLRADAIVNAANSQLLGCFAPLHACIDNAIHSAAGVQLREECYQLMQQQGHLEATGTAKITKGYNLPAKFVLHTVGPIISASLTDNDRHLLASCYRSCLTLAEENALQSVAFCCISTGVFRFPNEEAAKIAVATVSEYLANNPKSSLKKVIFNVFKDEDLQIYQNLLFS